MGIQNLLPFVAKACRQGTMVEFAGCTVAVDTSCLLHRGLFGCMDERAVGKDSKAYIYYVKKYVDALLDLNCHVIMVFDGRPLPAKKGTNDGRRAKRQENIRQGEILLSQGKTDEANNLFRQSTSITADVVENAIQFFRRQEGVDVLVAPYESDAQLAFLTHERLADVVVTEDSDLIAFGCEKIAFKWDASGPCTIYERAKLPLCFTGKFGSEFDFTTFRRICILAGCDYLQSGLKGVGLNKALTFFSKTSKTELREILPRVPSYLRMPKLKVTGEFVDDFIRAEKTFLHQVVYDPRSRCQRPLNPYPIAEEGKENKAASSKPSQDEIICVDDDDDDFVSSKPRPSSCSSASSTNGSQDSNDYSFAGSVLSSSQALRLALGNSSQSGSQIEDNFRLPTKIPSWSIWSDHYERRSQKKQRLDEEKKEKEREKKKNLGAFVLDSPEKRRKKKGMEDVRIEEKKEKEEEKRREREKTVDILDDFPDEDSDDDFVVRKHIKKIKTAPQPKKADSTLRRSTNGADPSLYTDALMSMYEVDEAVVVQGQGTNTAIEMQSVAMEVTISTSENTKDTVSSRSTVTVPRPGKAKSAAGKLEGAGRKRSRLEALEETDKAERSCGRVGDDEDDLPLPSPIPKLDEDLTVDHDDLDDIQLSARTRTKSGNPSLPLTPTTAKDTVAASMDAEDSAVASSSLARTSTPLSGRTLKPLRGARSGYFGMTRSVPTNNPFKKPRLIDCSTPPTPSSSVSSPITGRETPDLDKAMIAVTPKSASISDSLSQKLEIASGSRKGSENGTSPYHALFGTGCRAAGLRRSSSAKK